MTSQYLFPVYSIPATQFIEALAGAAGIAAPPFVASALYNLAGVPPSGSRRYLIRALELDAIQNFGPELNFFASGVNQPGATPAVDQFISRFGFTAAMGEQVGGAGLWRYYVDGLAIPYFDLDSANSATIRPTLHVIMQNIDVIAKAAGVPGAVQLTAWLEPMQGW